MSGPNLNYGYSGLEDNDCLLFERNFPSSAAVHRVAVSHLTFIFCTCSVLACRGNVHVQQLSAGLLDTD